MDGPHLRAKHPTTMEYCLPPKWRLSLQLHKVPGSHRRWIMEISAEFQVEAAHKLPHVPPEHNAVDSMPILPHRVHVKGPVNQEFGWVLDLRH